MNLPFQDFTILSTISHLIWKFHSNVLSGKQGMGPRQSLMMYSFEWTWLYGMCFAFFLLGPSCYDVSGDIALSFFGIPGILSVLHDKIYVSMLTLSDFYL